MTFVHLSEAHIQRCEPLRFGAAKDVGVCPLSLALQEGIAEDVLLSRDIDPFGETSGQVYGFYRQTEKEAIFIPLPERCQTFRRVWLYGHGGQPELKQFATLTASGAKVMHSWNQIIRPFEFSLRELGF